MSHAPSSRTIPDLSTLTPAAYAKLGRQDIELVHRLAFRANSELMRRAFADPNVTWVLIAGAPGKIMARGSRQDRVLDAQIDELEKHSNQVWFFYSRPDDLVEEVPRHEPRFPWAPPRQEPHDPSKPPPIGPFVDSALVARMRGEKPVRRGRRYPISDDAIG